MKNWINSFLSEEDGLTTVEYAAAGALISIAIVGTFTALGTQIAATLGVLTAAITPAG